MVKTNVKNQCGLQNCAWTALGAGWKIKKKPFHRSSILGNLCGEKGVGEEAEKDLQVADRMRAKDVQLW